MRDRREGKRDPAAGTRGEIKDTWEHFHDLTSPPYSWVRM